MRIVRVPGVYAPKSDTRLLAVALLNRAGALRGRSVADLCTGSGAVALTAAREGAEVVAVDISRRAVAVARLNARLNGLALDVRRGRLYEPLRGVRFDIVVANPPYLPAEAGAAPADTTVDAGLDGRALLDPVCDGAAAHLRPGGRLLLVQSSLSGEAETLERLRGAGLRADVVAREEGPLGPIAEARAAWLRAQGRLGEDGLETLLVVEARAG